MPTGFIRVPQGKICRFSSENTDYDGLYTDDFSSCNIIILRNNKRISMIHADSSIVDSKSIQEEERWVGDKCKIEVYAKKEGVKLFKKLFNNQQSVRLEEVPPDIWSISSKFEGNQKATQKQTYTIGHSIIRHPKESEFECLHKIHVVCFYILNPLLKVRTDEIKKWANGTDKLIFDGENWILPSNGTLQLHNQVKNIVESKALIEFVQPEYSKEISCSKIQEKLIEQFLSEDVISELQEQQLLIISHACVILGELIWSYHNSFQAYDQKLNNEYIKIKTERSAINSQFAVLLSCQDVNIRTGYRNLLPFVKKYFCREEIIFSSNGGLLFINVAEKDIKPLTPIFSVRSSSVNSFGSSSNLDSNRKSVKTTSFST